VIGEGGKVTEDTSRDSFLLGIDIGTSATKVILVDVSGRERGAAKFACRILHPRPLWTEHNPEDWWQAVVVSVREVLSSTGIRPSQVLCLGIVAVRDPVVFLGHQGQPLGNVIGWADRRTIRELDEIVSRVGADRIVEITGVHPHFNFSASKIRWVTKHLPDVLANTQMILSPKDYVLYRLCGEILTDYSTTSKYMLFDVKNRTWSEELCEAVGIPRHLLPTPVHSTELAGKLLPEPASLLGLPTGLPVAVGGGDDPATVLGAGILNSGPVNIGTGTSSAWRVVIGAEPRHDPLRRVDLGFHVVPDRLLWHGIIDGTGASLRWFRDNFCEMEMAQAARTGVDAYDLICAQAADIEPGAHGLFFYPYLCGARLPWFNPQATGVFFGLTEGHTKAHMARAILEGVAFQYVQALKMFTDLGCSSEKLVMVGGEVLSSLWNQIKSDVVNLPIVTLQVHEATSLGAAMLAALACGAYASAGEAAEEMVHIGSVYSPHGQKHERYMEIYERYEKVYRLLESGFEHLSPDWAHEPVYGAAPHERKV
jgi:xylulokinase